MSLTLSQTLASTVHLIPDWINRLLEEREREVERNESWNVMLVGNVARRMVWNICLLTGLLGQGVPGLACRLLEQFLAADFQKRSTYYISVDNEEVEELMDILQREMPLLMTTCVQLAAKMSSISAVVDLKKIRNAVLSNGNHSLHEMIDAEHRVLSTLDYRIPLWTSEETAELLAVEVGIPLSGIKVVAKVTDMAEYFRNKVNKYVEWVIDESPSSMSGKQISTLHLTAGAVGATWRVLSYELACPIPRLAELTRVPANYIKCIADAVLNCIYGVD